MDGGNEIPLRLWDFLQNFLINCTIKQSHLQMHPPPPQKGHKEVTSYFLIDLAEFCWCWKYTILFTFVELTDSTDRWSVLKAWSSAPCGKSRCCFIFIHVCSRTGLLYMWLSQRSDNFFEQSCVLLYYRKATVTSTDQQSKVCRGDSAVPIQTNPPIMSHECRFHWLFSQAESCYFKKEDWENKHLMCIFHIFQWEENRLWFL